MELAGPDDIIILMCSGWKHVLKNLQKVGQVLADHGGGDLEYALSNPRAAESKSFCCVFTPGQKNLSSHPHTWVGSFAFDPLACKYSPVHETWCAPGSSLPNDLISPKFSAGVLYLYTKTIDTACGT